MDTITYIVVSYNTKMTKYQHRRHKIVSTLKQHSTYLAWKNHQTMLKQHFGKEKTLWSDGYFAASISQVSQTTIEHYIENQG